MFGASLLQSCTSMTIIMETMMTLFMEGLLWLRWAFPKGKKTTWRNLSQGGDFWESASNSYYDLVNYLGFLGVQGKAIPCQRSN